MGRNSLLIVLLVSLPALSLCDPLFILTAPNVLRIESEETVVLEAHDFSSNIEVKIRLQDFPHRKVSLPETIIHLNADNQFLATAVVKIPGDKWPKDSRENQYAYLEASSPNFVLQTVILVSHQAGHVFIQTDKPIYTPTQTVLYRILSVDNDMKPSTKATIVELVNPQDVIVLRSDVRQREASGIVGMSFPVPEIVNIGIWKIIASYKDAPALNFTTQFEVKEYVLPSFEVTLESLQPFFYVDDAELHIRVTARFTYGKSVQGRAFILFGIMKDGEKLSIAKSLQSVPVIDGSGEASLKREHLTENFENIDELVGNSIYVTASVITHAGSDMVEAEKTNIKIVRSPYTISFSKTSKYFKPGMPFVMMVYVANPDGSPANQVPVKVDGFNIKSKTHADGITSLTVNTPGIASSFRIKVSTDVPNILLNQQANAEMVALPYKTQRGSKNYLHIGIQHKELHAGDDDLLVYLNIGNDNEGVREQIKYFTYMLISKGKIVVAKRQQRMENQRVVTLQFPIKANLIPSFRLLVYYYVYIGGQLELVADSVWIDVMDTCMGTLKISAANRDDQKRTFSPGEGLTMKLTGDPGAKVGLVAVDKAVFALSKKNKITQSKIWNVVEKSDIGCTPGSGSDVFGVFSDAGLAFVTNTNLKTEARTELTCKQPNLRKRRAAGRAEFMTETLQDINTKLQKRCCKIGMMANPMGYSCQKRGRRVTPRNECRHFFILCCETVKKYMDQLLGHSLSLGRSADGDPISYEDITVRSQFPESWLWQTYTLPKGKNGQASMEIINYLKDSITTWEIQAVSVSPNEGVCIAQPYDVTVLKDFFIDLRLPYSTIRHEQVEIRAVLYNYHDKDIRVRVQFPHNEHFCSSAKPKEKYTTTINIPRKSTGVVPYVIIPLTIGEIMIEVKASVYGEFVADGVRKPLRVQPEGIKTELPVQTHNLDPKGKEQVFNVSVKPPKDMVPHTEPATFISGQGDLLTQSIEKTIDGMKLKHLIRIPRGCGEQNMASMTPVVIVVKYLDEKNEWPLVGVDARETALNNIQIGYTQELAYRNDEGAFAAFLSHPSSTWLTAYVVKVFAMARNLITIEPRVLCGAVKWLILNRQKPDGHFEETGQVIHGEMIGGIHKDSSHAPLTAFVLIAIIEARIACSQHVQSYENSIKKGAAYLKDHIDGLQGSYGAVLSAYALSLVDVNKMDIVMKFASPDQSYWPVGGDANSLYTIEATGYALLFLLQQKQYDKAGKLVRWLSKRSEYGGGYSSTQATIVALQALATYLTVVPRFKKSNLDIDLSIPSKQLSFKWAIRQDNIYVARSRTFNAFEQFTVTATGEGQGSLKVLTTYYAMLPKGNKECKNFDLQITIGNIEKVQRPEGALNSLQLKICARYLSGTRSSMVILDVSMLTGFIPDTKDLEQLKNGIEKYISRFEVDKALSTAGSLIIYLDTVSNLEEDCVAFKVHQFFKVGLIQPAGVKIYEYYDTTKTCTRFYNVPEHSEMLNKICDRDVCKCVDGGCVSVKTDQRDLVQRDEISCAPGNDYVYKVTFTAKEKRDNYIYYTMKILIIIKQGSDAIDKDEDRQLIIHFDCNDKFNVELNQDYLIMGQSTDLWGNDERVRYLIGENTWIERWPSNAECQEEMFINLCKELRLFADDLQIFGCNT